MSGDHVAAGGLLHRRLFLQQGLAAGLGAGLLPTGTVRAMTDEPWRHVPGQPFTGYGQP
ncbi:sulfite dehydrogenase, partial [Candidatus Woesearchaeota archaeon]|nr:sulfite dehydrogenase [Candidatus Woesearchaeota archaeon]